MRARIASAMNKIIHNSHFKRRISLEEQKAQKQDRFLRGRQIAYLIYEYFWVTGANDSVENYADLSSTTEKNKRQTQDKDQRCQSGPSAKDSVIFSGGDSSKNCGADQQRLQISDLHLDKILTPATFACCSLTLKGIRMPEFEVLDARIASALKQNHP